MESKWLTKPTGHVEASWLLWHEYGQSATQATDDRLHEAVMFACRGPWGVLPPGIRCTGTPDGLQAAYMTQVM